ncbi:nucleotidyltransferase domain-containing protein [Leifsonia sp. fls2-241-R2A-40a]|uniref:nucleotidyltransferase domain-containing protein n=1 Tax=Leifsonia sp. fls2-241-R2A-40a TaxID=3040290 RepID=UPI00254F6AF6|nr:nucleotidyltransferase domain-containing protein [Leifsonia sp. fls2-241-R2A-40a]
MATPEPRAAEVALRFCDAVYPGATTVILGGSSSTGRRTATSDIDLLLIGPPSALAHAGADGAESPRSEARVAHRFGERFDAFAYTAEGFRDWSERDFASLRPVLPFLLTEGHPLRVGSEYDELYRWSADRLELGPQQTAHQLELRRYAITDLIDDLMDATEPLAAAAIRADLFRDLAQLALLASNSWLGSGKWLARRLSAADPLSAEALREFARTPDQTEAAERASRLLDRLGGRVDGDLVR